jgi:hypothetical protein
VAEEREPVAEEEEEEAEPGPAWQASSASAVAEVAAAAEEEVAAIEWAAGAERSVAHQTCRRNCDTSDRGVSECRISWSLNDLLESFDRKKQHAVMLAPFPCSER